jgi:DNA-binding LacI/PurR family transcriptional regulator
MFDVEREGWQAETKILLSRNHRQPSLSSGQPRASTTQDEEQGSLAAATAQHRKESGYEQIQVNGPDDYNKLLKQWMVRGLPPCQSNLAY